MIDLVNIVRAASEVATQAGEQPTGNVVQLLGINWKLFLAQLINFGIIFFVLWKWVFTPVTSALQKRTKKIEQSLKDAEDVKKQLADMEEYNRQQKVESRRAYDEVLSKAQLAGVAAKQDILAEAKKQAEKLVADAEAKITHERVQMVQEVKLELADLVVAASEKIINEKLDHSKDAKLIEQSLNSVK